MAAVGCRAIAGAYPLLQLPSPSDYIPQWGMVGGAARSFFCNDSALGVPPVQGDTDNRSPGGTICYPL